MRAHRLKAMPPPLHADLIGGEEASFVSKRDVLRTLASPALRAATPRGPKRFSAMVRVKNEEEFLRASVLSIVDKLDEVVLIDNLSTDRTPDIIRELCREFPDRVRTFIYPHELARPGAENVGLAREPGGRSSPRLIANYYNWCLAKCSTGWAVKWDADMIALPEFAVALDAFRGSSSQVLCISGANVYPDGRHYLKVESWYKETEFYEPRVFVRRFARYVDTGGPYETFSSPYRSAPWSMTHDPLTYIHLRYCRREPHAHWSVEDRVPFAPGRPLEAGLVQAFEALDR